MESESQEGQDLAQRLMEATGRARNVAERFSQLERWQSSLNDARSGLLLNVGRRSSEFNTQQEAIGRRRLQLLEEQQEVLARLEDLHQELIKADRRAVGSALTQKLEKAESRGEVLDIAASLVFVVVSVGAGIGIYTETKLVWTAVATTLGLEMGLESFKESLKNEKGAVSSFEAAVSQSEVKQPTTMTTKNDLDARPRNRRVLGESKPDRREEVVMSHDPTNASVSGSDDKRSRPTAHDDQGAPGEGFPPF